MIVQVDKHKKLIIYDIDNFIFLNRRYIKIAQSFDKFDDKKLNSFKIIITREIFYELELFNIIKIHSIFHSYLLRKNSQNSLLEQTNKSSNLIILKNNLK